MIVYIKLLIGNDVWTCYGVGHYHDMVPGSASFSEDGSVVAVAFNHVLTLWIPNTNTLKTILYHRCLNQPIK